MNFKIERPLFDRTKKIQSSEHYTLMSCIQTRVNRIRSKMGLSIVTRHGLCRFVKTVYRNDWNKLLVDLQNGSVDNTISKYGNDKFHKMVKSKRKRLDNTQSGISNGYVYIIYNPAWPDWVKVGSAVSVNERLTSYQTSDPNRAFVLCWSMFSNNRKEDEQLLRERIINKRIINKGVDFSNEWCRIHYSEVESLCKNLCLGT